MDTSSDTINIESQSLFIETESKKRSRIISDQGNSVSKGLRMNCGIDNINSAMEKLELVIDQCFKTEESCNTITKEQALETLNKVALEIIKATTKTLLQEEKITVLLQQIMALQTNKNCQSSAPNSYLEAAKIGENAKAICEGRNLPILQPVTSHKHSPSEMIIIIKAQTKGIIPSKQSQEEFRNNLGTIVGISISNEITAVRVTKYGGYLIIFRDSE